jgi:hypothetical protein
MLNVVVPGAVDHAVSEGMLCFTITAVGLALK